MRPDLYEGPADRYAGAEDLARDSSRRDPRGGLARRGAPAAAVVADSVFFPVGVVGVPRTEPVGDIAVVLRALVGVLDQQLDRSAGRHPVEGAAHDAHQISFAALRRVARLPRLALVEPLLDVGFGERQPRRDAVDDDTNRRPVAFAPGRETEECAERIACHRLQPIGRISRMSCCFN